MMKRPGLLLVGLAWLVGVAPLAQGWAGQGNGGQGDAGPSVAVSTVAVTQGSLPHQVRGYGMALVTQDASQTISAPMDAEISALPVTLNQAVHAGQRLAVLVPAPAMRNAVRQARTALTLARAQQARVARLLTLHLATTDQRDQAGKAVADAESALAALRAQGADAARLTLRAPFDGVITAVTVADGARVAANAALLRVTRARGATVRVGLPPALASLVAPGMPARLTPLEAGGATEGRVSRVAAGLNAATRQMDVDIIAGGRVVPGAAYGAAIVVGRWHGWLVPHAAVLARDDGTFHVFQVRGRAAHDVPVRVLGTTATELAHGEDVVAGALNPEAPVVVAGATQLTDGAAVRVVAAAHGAP